MDKCFDLGLKKDISGTRGFRSVDRCHFLVGNTSDNGGGGGGDGGDGGPGRSEFASLERDKSLSLKTENKKKKKKN